MKSSSQLICKLSLIILTCLIVFSSYSTFDVRLITAFLGFVILVFSIPLMNKSFKVPIIIFLILSIGIFFFTGQSLITIVTGANSMLNIIAIIIIMQLFSIPIQVGGYDKAIELLLHGRFKKNTSLYSFVTVITHLFGSFLLFGTVPVMMALMGDTLKKRIPISYKRFTATAISRGYSLVVLWTPGGVNILLILQATGVKWSKVFLPGLFLSVIGIIISRITEKKWIAKGVELSQSKIDYEFDISEKDSWRKISHILIVVIFLVMLTLIQEKTNNLSSTARIMNAGLLIVAVWILFYIKKPGLRTAFKDYWNSGVVKALDLAGLFVAIGIFSKTIENSGVLSLLQTKIPGVLEATGFLTVILVPIVIIFCAIIGIHPFISIVIFGDVLSSMNLQVSPLTIALSLSIGGAISYNVSPFTGIVMTMAKYVESSPVEVGFKWNGKFNIIFFVVSIIFIYVHHILF